MMTYYKFPLFIISLIIFFSFIKIYIRIIC